MMVAAGVCVRVCVWMDYGRSGRYVARRRHVNRRQRRVEAMAAVTCYQAAMAAPVAATAAGRGVTVMMVPEDDPREGHGSLMMLRGAVRVMRLRDHVVTRGWCVRSARMMVTAGRRVVVRVVGAAAVVVVVVILLLGLPLTVLLVLHTTILKPDLHLTLGQIQIARELPPLLLRHVSVEEKLLLQLESLEFRIGFAFLPYRHLARPLQGIRTAASNAHPGYANPDAHPRKRTCGKQGRWGGTPHHLTQLVCLMIEPSC